MRRGARRGVRRGWGEVGGRQPTTIAERGVET